MMSFDDFDEGKEFETLDVDEFKHQTTKAWLVVIDGDDVWVPKSISIYEPEDDPTSIQIQQWFCEKEGLI